MASEVHGAGAGLSAEAKEKVKLKTTLKGSMGERINKALVKVEDKKRKRAHRRAQVRDHSKWASKNP